LEDPAKVLPLFLCKWKFADQWRLDAGLTDLATVGYGASVTWMPTSEWEFSGGIQYHKSRFRIDGGNDVAKDGIGEESAATVYVASAWHVCPHADLGAFLGAAVGGKVALENKGGNTLFEHDYKPGAVLGINATFKF
jgi:hypothetical protein